MQKKNYGSRAGAARKRMLLNEVNSVIQVASYCRVSTDREDQMNSFEAQQRYFREYIVHHEEWTLYKVYADEGISGTSTKKRVQFNRMISDAYEGRFQLILTKEVSRFSRNILDTIHYTRELKRRGIGVLFLNDNINTLDPDAELRLSIMASIAQEESRRTSQRVKWGQTRQMECGVVFGRSLLGYHVQNGRITIEPEGAELVKLIFHKYGVEKKGTTTIVRELREAGYRTYSGNPNWSNSHIVKILKNEKYAGDLVQKKTITPDYLTHEKKSNCGEEELVIIKNHHEPIIDRELWETVQTELHRRSRRNYTGTHSTQYPFSGKIRCGECGAGFISRIKYRRDGSSYRRWGCHTAVNEGTKHTNCYGCNVGRLLRDDTAAEMIKIALQSIHIDRIQIIENVSELASAAIREESLSALETSEQLLCEIDRISKKKEDMLDAFFADDISKSEMQSLKERYEKQLADLRERLNCVRNDIKDQPVPDEIRIELAEILNGEHHSDTLIRNLVERVTVFKDRHTEIRLAGLPMVFYFSG